MPAEPAIPARTRNLILLALALLFIGVGISTVYRAAFGDVERTDFTVYQAAGQAVLDGTSIYDAKNVRGWYYTALPLFAAVCVPLALLSKAAGALVWYVLCLAALLHAAWIAGRLAEHAAGPTRGGTAGTALAALVLTAWPWLSGLTRGQVSVPLAWMAIVAIDLFLRRRDRWGPRIVGGFALAGAVIAKVFPALLIGWLILRRDWRATAGALLGLAVLLLPAPALVFGWQGNIDLLTRWVTAVAMPLGDAQQESHARYSQMLDPRIAKNQSVQAVAVRIAAPSEEAGGADTREQIARIVAAALNFGLLAATVAACWLAGRRAPPGSDDERAIGIRQASAFVLLSLFVAPLTWSHYYTIALLPAALAAAAAFGGAIPEPWARRYRIAVIIWLVGFLAAAYEPIYRLGSHLIAGLAVWSIIVWHLFDDGMPRRSPTAKLETP